MQALAVGTSVLMTRLLGADGRGEYALIVAIATMAVSLATMGLVQAQFRAWSTDAAGPKVLVATGTVLAWVLGTLAAGAMVLLARVAPSVMRSTDLAVVAVVAISIPVQVHRALDAGLLSLSGRMMQANNALFIGAAVQAALLGFLAVRGQFSVTTVVAAYAAAQFVAWAVQRASVRKVAAFDLRGFSARVSRALIRDGVAIQPYLFLTLLNLRIDTLFLAASAGVQAVGIYSIAVVIAEAVWLVTDALTYALAERQANATEDEMYRVTLIAIRTNLVLAALVAAVIAGAARALLVGVFGREFAEGTAPVRTLLIASMAMAVWRPISGPMLRAGRLRLMSVIAVAVATANILGNALLTPAYGVLGAATASALSYSLGALLALRWFMREANIRLADLVPTRADFGRLRQALPGSGAQGAAAE